MKRVILANPPNPDDAQFRGHPLAYNRALFQWANDTKGKVEQASRVNDVPLSQSFIVSGTFMSSNTVTSTMTGTDLANFICSFITALTSRGMVTPNENA
ncbi:MAG TPA: hypothetical protein VJQ82_16505 [Terriglobales bacterium]|nr:hypothetical protein [Terriglobales bacterium]